MTGKRRQGGWVQSSPRRSAQMPIRQEDKQNIGLAPASSG